MIIQSISLTLQRPRSVNPASKRKKLIVVGKDGFWDNSSPSFHEGELKWGRGSKFWATPTAIFLKSDFFHTRKGKGEFFEFGPLKIWFLGFFTKIFNFWIFRQKGSKYSSFEIFGVNFWFLAPSPLFFRFSPKKFQILDFSPKRFKIL